MIDPQNPADRELHGLTRESHAPENLADPFQQGWRQGPYDLWYDYHSHMLAMNALRNVNACRFRVSDRVRFLDLACSNLRMTAFFLSDFAGVRVLAGHEPVDYLGVHTSPKALSQDTLWRFGTSVRMSFVEADFVEFLRTGVSRFDMIFISMSAHHLGLDRLPEFFAGVKERLAPGGIFVAYEPFCLPGESRNEHIERLHALIRNEWTRLTDTLRKNMIAHTGECDFPVTLAEWNDAARMAGMNPGQSVFESPDQLYAMVVHEA